MLQTEVTAWTNAWNPERNGQNIISEVWGVSMNKGKSLGPSSEIQAWMLLFHCSLCWLGSPWPLCPNQRESHTGPSSSKAESKPQAGQPSVNEQGIATTIRCKAAGLRSASRSHTSPAQGRASHECSNDTSVWSMMTET